MTAPNSTHHTSAPEQAGGHKQQTSVSRLRVKHPAFRWILLITPAFYVALATFPAIPYVYPPDLDGGWILGLNMAYAQGLVAGKDVVFTYGPMGFLANPDPTSGAKSLVLIYRIGIHAFWIAALVRLMFLAPSKLVAAFVVLIMGIVATIDPILSANQLEYAVLTWALLPLVARSRHRYLDLALAAALAGLSAMVKLNQGIHAIAVVTCVLIATILRDRPLSRTVKLQSAGVLTLIPLTACLVYAASTGHIASMWSYVRYSLEIVSGYSEAVSLVGPAWHPWLVFVTLMALVAVIPLTSQAPRSLLAGIGPAAISGFLFSKHALVRQWVAEPFEVKIVVASVFLLVCASSTRDRRVIIFFQCLCLFLGYRILLEAIPYHRLEIRERLLLKRTAVSAKRFLRWPQTWDELQHVRQASLEKLRLDRRFHDLIKRGSVDAFPWDIARIKANDWHWRPRPIFQSFIAYTPALDRINAEHIQGDRGADFTLMSWGSIDDRHPSLEDPASSRAVLDWYDPELYTTDFLLMRRRSAPRYGPLQYLGSSVVGWDREISIPQERELLVMAVEMELSLSGKLRNFVYRLEPPYVEVVRESGRKSRWRAVRANLSHGVVINQMPQSLSDVAVLTRRSPAVFDRVRSIRFQTANPREYRDTILLRWYRVPLRDSHISPEPPFAVSAMVPLWLPGGPIPAVHLARLERQPKSIALFPFAEHPQINFPPVSSLKDTQTLVVRARFGYPDLIYLFFGRHWDGRGLGGQIPAINQWLDVYIYAHHNLFWHSEYGTRLRFDPAWHAGAIGSRIDIAGVWGSSRQGPIGAPDLEFYRTPRTEEPTSTGP